MGKSHTQTVNRSADAATTGMQGQVYDASKNAAANYTTVGPNANTNAAMGVFGDVARQGQVGSSALAGDQGSIDKMMNPYLSSVLGGYENQFGRESNMLQNTMDAGATGAGAFGGSRAAVASGAAQGNLGAAHMSQVADLLHSGYNDAMQRAGGLANLGLSAAGSQFQGGDYLRQIAQQQANPGMMQTQILGQGLQSGNVGNSSTSQTTHTGALQNILGAAATFGPMFFGMPPNPGGMSAFGGGGGGGGAYDPNDPNQNMFAGSNAAPTMPFGANNYAGGLFGKKGP